MKLQVNTSGSWRDVLEFPASQLPRVLFVADGLIYLPSEPPEKLSIVDDAGRRYYRAFEQEGTGWKTVWRHCNGTELTTAKRRKSAYG